MKVLDHGEVELKEFTDDADRVIATSARVQPDADWRPLEDRKLIRYMLEHGHTSPFEHVHLYWYVKAPIFVLRQWHRHRTWSYNEISGLS